MRFIVVVSNSRSGSRSNYMMGEVSAMRQFLAVAFLGATLAFSASAAFAFGDKVDYVPSYQPAQSVVQPTQNVSIVSRTESSVSTFAGGRNTTATDVYRQLREDNRER